VLANIQAAGLVGQVEVLRGFQLGDDLEQFDYVLAEAILTMQSPPGKTKILRPHRPSQRQFLSHELPARKHEQQIHRSGSGN